MGLDFLSITLAYTSIGTNGWHTWLLEARNNLLPAVSLLSCKSTFLISLNFIEVDLAFGILESRIPLKI